MASEKLHRNTLNRTISPNTAQGMPFWNPESKFHWKSLESSTWNPESTVNNLESKTIKWGDSTQTFIYLAYFCWTSRAAKLAEDEHYWKAGNGNFKVGQLLSFVGFSIAKYNTYITSSTEGNRNQALFGYCVAHIQEASQVD